MLVLCHDITRSIIFAISNFNLTAVPKNLETNKIFFLRFPIWNVQNGTVGGSILSRAAFFEKSRYIISGALQARIMFRFGLIYVFVAI
jgi:hypothetical protein